MKQLILRSTFVVGCLLLLGLVQLSVLAEIVQIDQSAILFSSMYQRGVNYSSFRGVPGNASTITPPPTDGRAPAGGTPCQFQGVVSYGAVVIPRNGAILQSGKTFEQNAVALELPRGEVGGVTTVVLRSSKVGGFIYSESVSLYFGGIITPPSTDLYGAKLTTMRPDQYWYSVPYTNSSFTGSDYYYSPNANQVFATVAGPVEVTWRVNNSGDYSSLAEGTGKVTIGGLQYGLSTVKHIVSGAASKTPRKIYWTEKSFTGGGKPVSVPSATVGGIYFAYSPGLPMTVNREFVDGNVNPGAGTTNATLQELRTIWYDSSQGLILAYNVEGRIFMELLGDRTTTGKRVFLGYEIVDIFQQPVPQALISELGEKITAYGVGGLSDAGLLPVPLQTTMNGPFLYQDSSATGGRTEYYSAALSVGANDVQVYWMGRGEAGIYWPTTFNRYNQIWPDDPVKYSNYLRPNSESALSASQTAVQLSPNNVPAIQFQDLLDYPRAQIDESSRFYTVLDTSQPQHRTLLRLSSGTVVAFERVLSSLSTSLNRGDNSAFADVSGVLARPGQSSRLILDGVNGYGKLPSNLYFTSGSYTVEAWVKVTETANGARLLDFSNVGPQQNVLLALSSGMSGKPAARLPGGDVEASVALLTNQWTHIASVFDSTTFRLAIFINGVMSGSVTSSAPPNVNTTLNYVGKSAYPNDAYANAQIDSFRIWTVARTPSELQSGMQTNGYPSGTIGLKVQYNFDEGGRVAYDSSGNNLHMDLYGGASLSSSSLAQASSPRYLFQKALVGDRITPPSGELGSTGFYSAGSIRQSSGVSFHPGAYQDPFAVGFSAANMGAIIPVNAIPGANILEVWWFRQNVTNKVKNTINGFEPIYWPAVIGRYSLAWPDNPDNQIVMAGNSGSGSLASLQAKGTIYTQNDPTLAGYNPNEEHALMIGGQAYALRDDLNLTTSSSPAIISGQAATYSSAPYVLLDYTDADGRPAMRAFKVQRENKDLGLVFDYVVEAGMQVQAPMPLPVIQLPLATITNLTATSTNIYTTNYNSEMSVSGGDFPKGWSASETNGPFSEYTSFTYRDRKNSFWVMRGMHAGLPKLTAGIYNSTSTLNDGFSTSVVGGGTQNQPSTNYIHTSRRIQSLVTSVSTQTPLPTGVSFGALNDGLAVYGTWKNSPAGPYELSINDGDGSQVTVSFTYNSAKAPQSAIKLNGFTGRPPKLAETPTTANSFNMRFYYQTQDGFAWPGNTAPPPIGTIVPYLRPYVSGSYDGRGDSPADPAQTIVYRPVWPGNTLSVAFGETLTVPNKGRPAIRGQSSALVLYQQSIGLAAVDRANYPSVILHDPTRLKSFALKTNVNDGLTQLPIGVSARGYQGKIYFPNLPPHLANRFYYDPNSGPVGSLTYEGMFQDEPTGEKYLQLNVLTGSDLNTVLALCPRADQNKDHWDDAVRLLAVNVETFYEDPRIPGQYIVNPQMTVTRGAVDLITITNNNTPVDSYALSAAGPGQGYITIIVGNGSPAVTPAVEPVSMYVMRVTGQLYQGEVKVIPSDNPLSELITFEHTADLAAKTADYEYEWKIAPPVDGFPPVGDAAMSRYQALKSGTDIKRFTLGASGVLSLSDNWLVLRYRPKNSSHPLYNQWSGWTAPKFAEGYVKRVLAGINPFNQRTSDLGNNAVNTGASMLTQAGKRYEGDIALNQDALNSYGLIEIYETVLNRARKLSITAGINYGPANDSLLLAAGYLSDLYKILGDEAFDDAGNPTIGIGTKDKTYGDIATALFSFKGEVASLLDEELGLLEGRDDVALPGVQAAPVYNRLVWNYTGGIDSGQSIYALNYNILDQNLDGSADAADAAILYPQGHGDAYGHYLSSVKGYHSLLMNPSFEWVPRVQSVTVLGLAVTVGYQDERKFASAAAAVARTGRQIFDVTWRKYYVPDLSTGWQSFSTNRVSARTVMDGTNSTSIVREWGIDQWASRVSQGALVNWVIGNALLPDVDPDPSHEGIQKVDRTTVPELNELVATAGDLQAAMDNAEGRLSPLGVTQGSIAFDLNPAQIVGSAPMTHFEQVYERTKLALNNAVEAFDDAKDITRLMRSEGDSLADVQAQLSQQELSFTNALIELYGTPYPDDKGPGKTYVQDYAGPDLYHYMYVQTPELKFPSIVEPDNSKVYRLDVQNLPTGWVTGLQSKPESFDFLKFADNGKGQDLRSSTNYVEYLLTPHGYFGKPSNWTGRRQSPGQLQQAISEQINARGALLQVLDDSIRAKQSLDGIIRLRKSLVQATAETDKLTQGLDKADQIIDEIENAAEIFSKVQKGISSAYKLASDAASASLPTSLIAGLSMGGDLTSIGRGVFKAAAVAVENSTTVIDIARQSVAYARKAQSAADSIGIEYGKIKPLEQTEDNRAAMVELENALNDMQKVAYAINRALQNYDDAQRKVAALTANGDRILHSREIARQHTASIIQGFSSRDAAFRFFRSEKLERYKTLFDLASRYALLTANAYDYETGLLGTDQGKSFISRIIRSRALGVVRNGHPHFAGSETGDPGISSELAEMKADFDVLKGRLGFNSPDVYTTLASIRTGNLRIMADSTGRSVWQDYLQRNVKDNILNDADVLRYCQQVDRGDGLPVPGIVLTFSTSINSGQNLFGQALAAGDPTFHRSSFATKINSVGIALEGYKGMNLLGQNGTSDPNLSYLDPQSLSANPYVYLIPVGVDIMRSPPLGDASQLRQWKVDDVAIPLPFNIGGSGFSSKNFYQSSDSLTEPLFTIRKHQAFRPVDSGSQFTGNPYFGSSLQFSQFTNRRLVGRSVWNSQWKLVIPADSLLADPKEGLNRLIQTLTDIKLYFTTYSYAGN